MILKEIALLIVASPRSNAYIQALVKKKYIPSYILIMNDTKNRSLLNKPLSDYLNKKTREQHKNCFLPLNLDISIMELIKQNKIPFEIINMTDANDPEVIASLGKRHEKYFIFSGRGGNILKKEILESGKKFIHMHAGAVPQYRGSTTIYFSILKERKCSSSAFFLDRALDAGAVLRIKDYPLPAPNISIDYVYDPYIRSDLLSEVIKDFITRGKFKTQFKQTNGKDVQTYFIIHPVLKHLSILSLSDHGQ